MMTRVHSIVIGAVILMASAAVLAPAHAQQQKYFNRAWIDGQIGRVGYHMAASLKVYPNDKPAGCDAYFDSWEIQGTLPPGLTSDAANARFDGTPRQPGEWNIPLILHGVGCSNTGGRYGDRQINLHFHIDP